MKRILPAAKWLPESLREFLQNMPSVAVAYSGGLDSRFLAHAAHLCGCQVFLMHATGPHVPGSETEFAVWWARKRELPYLELDYNPLQWEEVRATSPTRCYICKQGMLRLLQDRLAMALSAPICLCDGGNCDDLKAYRPGMAAVAEAGVVSPLALAGFGKAEIHKYARKTGLEYPDQKARPCLLTRFAYGLPVREDQLCALAAAESELARVLRDKNGEAPDFRLRLAPRPVLQIQKECNLDHVREILAKYGFDTAVIVVEENVSGFFDKISY